MSKCLGDVDCDALRLDLVHKHFVGLNAFINKVAGCADLVIKLSYSIHRKLNIDSGCAKRIRRQFVAFACMYIYISSTVAAFFVSLYM